jgi:hypothetical protein
MLAKLPACVDQGIVESIGRSQLPRARIRVEMTFPGLPARHPACPPPTPNFSRRCVATSPRRAPSTVVGALTMRAIRAGPRELLRQPRPATVENDSVALPQHDRCIRPPGKAAIIPNGAMVFPKVAWGNRWRCTEFRDCRVVDREGWHPCLTTLPAGGIGSSRLNPTRALQTAQWFRFATLHMLRLSFSNGLLRLDAQTASSV